MARPPEPLFLERQTYRRRRLMDAARLLPFAGAVLFALPMLWVADGSAASTAAGGLYLFAVWTGLIAVSALIARRLRHSDTPLDGRDDRDAP